MPARTGSSSCGRCPCPSTCRPAMPGAARWAGPAAGKGCPRPRPCRPMRQAGRCSCPAPSWRLPSGVWCCCARRRPMPMASPPTPSSCSTRPWWRGWSPTANCRAVVWRCFGSSRTTAASPCWRAPPLLRANWASACAARCSWRCGKARPAGLMTRPRSMAIAGWWPTSAWAVRPRPCCWPMACAPTTCWWPGVPACPGKPGPPCWRWPWRSWAWSGWTESCAGRRPPPWRCSAARRSCVP